MSEALAVWRTATNIDSSAKPHKQRVAILDMSVFLACRDVILTVSFAGFLEAQPTILAINTLGEHSFSN
jgi:hypothetical protein